jgi:hypothetical protein
LGGNSERVVVEEPKTDVLHKKESFKIRKLPIGQQRNMIAYDVDASIKAINLVRKLNYSRKDR